MKTSKSSRQWLDEHFNDPYVKKAWQEGYRSRAVYKLLEIHEKYKIFKPGMIIVDLGAAPGGWSQIITRLIGAKGSIFAVDILPMESIKGVEFLQGDFADPVFLQLLMEKVIFTKIDWVISDMAPNATGIRAVDQPRMMYLAELALDLAQKILKPGGGFLIKVFQGQDFDAYLKMLRSNFKSVQICKPKASRTRSSEIYLLARDFKGILSA